MRVMRQSHSTSKPRRGVGSNQHKTQPQRASTTRQKPSIRKRSLDESLALEEICRDQTARARDTHQRNIERFSTERIELARSTDQERSEQGPYVIIPWEDDTHLPHGAPQGFYVVDSRKAKEGADPEENLSVTEGFHYSREQACQQAINMHRSENGIS